MNKMRKSAVVYPVDKEFVALFRYKDLLHQYDKLIPVSPNGYGFANKDVGVIDKGEQLGISISNDFANSITNVQEVIFTVFSDPIYEKIQYAIQNGKDIVLLFLLEEETEKLIKEECVKHNVVYRNLASEKDELQEQNYSKDKIIEINVPIVVVCGLSEHTQKFDIQLKLRESFKAEGYRVSQVGSRKYSQIFDMHNFPSYMLEKNDEVDKIYYFNSFIKSIEINENPDIIIVGVPGGVMPYDMEHSNGFGILNYLVSNALSADYVILSLAYNDYENNFFEHMTNYMKYRYDYGVIKFHLSNIFHDIYDDERIEGERFVYIGQESLGNRIEELKNHNVFHVGDVKENADMMHEIIDYLSN